MILFPGVTAILPYPPPLPNYQLPIATVSKDDVGKKKLASLKTDIDKFHVHGREIYWLCKKETERIKDFKRGT